MDAKDIRRMRDGGLDPDDPIECVCYLAAKLNGAFDPPPTTYRVDAKCENCGRFCYVTLPLGNPHGTDPMSDGDNGICPHCKVTGRLIYSERPKEPPTPEPAEVTVSIESHPVRRERPKPPFIDRIGNWMDKHGWP